MFAARAMHVRQLIRPALGAASGWCAIASRMRRAPTRAAAVALIEPDRGARAGGAPELAPDCTLLLDLPVAHGLARAHARAGGAAPTGSRWRRVEFFERVRAGYLELARREPERFRVIDAGAPLRAGRAPRAQPRSARLRSPGPGRATERCAPGSPALRRPRRGCVMRAAACRTRSSSTKRRARAGSGSPPGRRSWCCAGRRRAPAGCAPAAAAWRALQHPDLSGWAAEESRRSASSRCASSPRSWP